MKEIKFVSKEGSPHEKSTLRVISIKEMVQAVMPRGGANTVTMWSREEALSQLRFVKVGEI